MTNTFLILRSYVIHISFVSRLVPAKPKNFRGLCIIWFLKLRSSRYMFIKTSWSNSLIYLWKLTSIYIFKLGISHYVLIGAAKVIHISTVTLVFSVQFLLVHIKNKLSIFTCLWGPMRCFRFPLYKFWFYWFFSRNELKTKPVIFCGPKDLRETEDLIWRFRLNNNFQFIGALRLFQYFFVLWCTMGVQSHLMVPVTFPSEN